jgi:hypothetical protein
MHLATLLPTTALLAAAPVLAAMGADGPRPSSKASVADTAVALDEREAGRRSRRQCHLDLSWIESIAGRHPDKQVRKWPLGVVRLRATHGADTRLEILPASAWNAA